MVTEKGKKEITFVNSFRGSGIGDFGWKLKDELEKKVRIKYIEIVPSWKGLICLWNDILWDNSKVVFNIGFTSLGKSIYRNFMNFLMLKFFSTLHKTQPLILHDSIDTSSLEHSGYSNSWIMRLGGSVATKMLGNFKIFVFSQRFYDILKVKYGFKHINYFPFPTERRECRECYRRDKDPLLLNVGYIAPYKGLEILPEVKNKLNDIETAVVGDFYKTLLSTKIGSEYKEMLVNVMRDSKITLSGYMDDDNLIEFVEKHRAIGILPYVSGYNASSSAILFVTLGLPVVATNIDVFMESWSNGAGIILVERTPDTFANAIKNILETPDLADELIERDRRYCAKYSISNFCGLIVDC
jgi:glycosyltransferase involved in cell wall biosynthesis